MNKKGNFFGDNALGIFIAVISLIALGFGAAMVYKAITAGEFELSQKNIDLLEKKSESIKSGQETKITIQEPCDGRSEECKWYIRAWGANTRDKPSRCIGSCVCICPKDDFNCESSERSVCRKFNFDEIKISSKMSMRTAKPLSEAPLRPIDPTSPDFQRIIGVECPFVILDKPLIELNVARDGESLLFSGECTECILDELEGKLCA